MYMPITQYRITVWEKLESAKAKTVEYYDVVNAKVNSNGDLTILRAQYSQFSSVGFATGQWQKYEVTEDYGCLKPGDPPPPPIMPMHDDKTKRGVGG